MLGMEWQATGNKLHLDWIRYRAVVDLSVRAELIIDKEDAILYRVVARDDTDKAIKFLNFNACFSLRHGLHIIRGKCDGRDFTLAHGSPDAILLWHT